MNTTILAIRFAMKVYSTFSETVNRFCNPWIPKLSERNAMFNPTITRTLMIFITANLTGRPVTLK